MPGMIIKIPTSIQHNILKICFFSRINVQFFGYPLDFLLKLPIDVQALKVYSFE